MSARKNSPSELALLLPRASLLSIKTHSGGRMETPKPLGEAAQPRSKHANPSVNGILNPKRTLKPTKRALPQRAVGNKRKPERLTPAEKILKMETSKMEIESF